MDSNKNFAPIVILLLVAAIAVGGWLWKTNKLNIPGTPNNTPVVPTLVASLQGDVVAGFPKELILPKDAKIQSSSIYHLDSRGQSVLTVYYFTNATLPDLFGGYLNYFTDNGYKTFLSESKPTKSSISAKGPSYAVGVTMSLIDTKTMRVEVDVTKTDPK